MSMTRVGLPGLTFERRSEPITINTMGGAVADPAWKYKDKRGHMHRAYRAGTSDTVEYPTLKWVEDEPEWCPDCHEHHERGHWECPVCGEEIEPGTKMVGPQTKQVPGMTELYINDIPVTEETWQQAMDLIDGATEQIKELIEEGKL